MSKIQIDMFDVQLGASLLLKFLDDDGNPIRVLSDAGITVKDKYPQDHVRNILLGMMENEKFRLDLVIGTHYDEDHLLGLVPVIEDDNIEIAEVWLPPVANDTELQPVGGRILQRDLLADQFAGANGHQVLVRYLQAKQAACTELLALERSADESRTFAVQRAKIQELDLASIGFDTGVSHREPDLASTCFDASGLDRALEYFSFHQADAATTLQDTAPDFDLHEFTLMSNDPHEVADLGWRTRPWMMDVDIQQEFAHRWKVTPSRAEADAVRLAYLRKASAKDAITAIHLARVVAALMKKKEKYKDLRIACHIIEDGVPQRFVWDKRVRCFIQGNRLPSHGPEILQLGPSQALVQKLREKLPVAEHVSLLAFTPVPVKSITPSNQLSYVLRFEAEKQGILVCGDAGCVDFKETRRKYYRSLLERLLPLHVLQIAHHGGCNGHFYNVLLEAGYPDQTQKSLLLLSHATEDAYRPSKEFGDFIGQARLPGDDMQILFTNRPSTDKVRDYMPIIHPAVGNGQTHSNHGDVRVSYDGGQWKVEKHAVDFSPLLSAGAAIPTAAASSKGRKRKGKNSGGPT